MKLLWITLLLAACTSIPTSKQYAEQTPPLTPEARTARLTSHLLLKKLDALRATAVYLQHREEGRRLIELALPEYAEDSEKKEGSGTGEVVE